MRSISSHFLDSLAFKTEGTLPGIFPKNVVRIVRLFLHYILKLTLQDMSELLVAQSTQTLNNNNNVAWNICVYIHINDQKLLFLHYVYWELVKNLSIIWQQQK
jgi:hypothetical protein